MRLRTRKALLNFAFFGGALCFILYVNVIQSRHVDKRRFAWTRVRYSTTAVNLPAAYGVCPGLASSAKPALVVSRVAADGNAEWTDRLSELYHLCVYTVDGSREERVTHLQVPANRGHEAMAYLTFLIDNFDDIPAAGTVFVHGSRWAWHNDSPEYDNAALLAALNVSAALAPSGYHNLRCDWSASTCAPDYGPPQGSLETSVNARLQPWAARAVSDAALSHALSALFGGKLSRKDLDARVLLGRRDAVRAQCCAQFVVSRERVWQHSRDEYVALRQWLLDGSKERRDGDRTPNKDAAPADDRIAGRILSYIWHIIFLPIDVSTGQDASNDLDLDRLNALACPRADECYCRLYGRCDLQGCDEPGTCRGQYILPPDFSLSDDWAATHS
ncbi:hypothetical protein LTR08_002595 [Meristemomyces frigidus]|nr:hypothetical protein LTR08_002595 [Meristemomyces frigidus]